MNELKPLEVRDEAQARIVVERLRPRLKQSGHAKFYLSRLPSEFAQVNIMVENLGNEDGRLYSGVLLADLQGEPAGVAFSCNTPRCEDSVAENEEWTYFFDGTTVSGGIVPT